MSAAGTYEHKSSISTSQSPYKNQSKKASGVGFQVLAAADIQPS
jgi:hypothetical protein